MNKNKGWYKHPREHAMAARGIPSSRGICIAQGKYTGNEPEFPLRVYHGTNKKALARILKEGHIAAHTGSSGEEETLGVYFTDNEGEAFKWAKAEWKFGKQVETPIILELEIPEVAKKNLEIDSVMLAGKVLDDTPLRKRYFPEEYEEYYDDEGLSESEYLQTKFDWHDSLEITESIRHYPDVPVSWIKYVHTPERTYTLQEYIEEELQ